MSDPGDNRKADAPVLRLADVIRDVKNAAADRDDVVVELREASRTRLELLAAELAPVFGEVPADIDLFDFTISSGLQPRLWIDAVSHVAMGRDRRTYRFVKDTRRGRVVLAEAAAIGPVAEQVARYVAERIIDRERLLDGTAAAGTARARPPRTCRDARSIRRQWLALLPVGTGTGCRRRPCRTHRLHHGALGPADGELRLLTDLR